MRISKRKTESSPGAQVKVSQKPFAETLVTGVGLCSLAGNQPFALLGAVGALLSGIRPDPTVTVLGAESEEVPVLRAAIPELAGVEGVSERFTLIAEEAFAGMTERLPKQEDTQGKTLVTILVPGKDTGRGAFLDREAMEEALVALHPLLQEAAFRFLPAEIGTPPLIDICRELSEGLWDVVLFAGVDSLVDQLTCAELMREGRLLSLGASGGSVPGEAAVCLLLQRSGEKRDGTALGRIAGAGWSRQADGTERPSESSLAAAVEEALAQAGRSPSELQSIILPFGEDPAEALEWYRASRRLWPQGGEQDSSTCEELRFSLALGEVGAAALPLSLALACARFDFEHPAVSAVVACEKGAVGKRGAVCLLPPRRESKSR